MLWEIGNRCARFEFGVRNGSRFEFGVRNSVRAGVQRFDFGLRRIGFRGVIKVTEAHLYLLNIIRKEGREEEKKEKKERKNEIKENK